MPPTDMGRDRMLELNIQRGNTSESLVSLLDIQCEVLADLGVAIKRADRLTRLSCEYPDIVGLRVAQSIAVEAIDGLRELERNIDSARGRLYGLFDEVETEIAEIRANR